MKTNASWKHVMFDPWQGSNYSNGGIFKKKILILGGSHYCETCETCGDRLIKPECTGFTKEVVEDYLNPECKVSCEEQNFRWKRTFSRFINSMYRHSTSQEERECFFDSIIFYNYLQYAAGKTWNVASNFDHSENRHLEAFFEVLDKYMPDVVICWGKRVWDTLPNDWRYGEATKPILSVDNKDFYCRYYYPYKDKTIMLVGVNHPSSPSFDSTFHHELFKKLDLL